MTFTEQRSQVALWATLASPLILAFPLDNVDNATLALITNKGAIAVSQTSTQGGRPLTSSRLGNGTIATQVYGRVLTQDSSDPVVALVLFNRLETTAPITVDLSRDLAPLGVTLPANVSITDVWTGEVLKAGHVTSYSANVPAHDVAFVRVAAQGP